MFSHPITGENCGASPNHPPSCVARSTWPGGSRSPKGQTETEHRTERGGLGPPRLLSGLGRGSRVAGRDSRQARGNCAPALRPAACHPRPPPLYASRPQSSQLTPPAKPRPARDNPGPCLSGGLRCHTTRELRRGSGRHQGAAGGRCALRPPDATLESQDAPLHLRRARRDPHHRPSEDRAAAAKAQEFAAEVAGRGGTILFVGTKKQARDAVREAATWRHAVREPALAGRRCSPTSRR